MVKHKYFLFDFVGLHLKHKRQNYEYTLVLWPTPVFDLELIRFGDIRFLSYFCLLFCPMEVAWTGDAHSVKKICVLQNFTQICPSSCHGLVIQDYPHHLLRPVLWWNHFHFLPLLSPHSWNCTSTTRWEASYLNYLTLQLSQGRRP